MRILLFTAALLFSACSTPAPEPISEPTAPHLIEHGARLAKGIAACGFCHGSPTDPNASLSGGRLITDRFGEVRAANITAAQSGLAGWTPSQVLAGIREARSPVKELLSPDVHRGFEWMSDEDAIALVAYVMALPPIENDVERRTVGTLQRNTTGFFTDAPDVRGFVPALSPKFRLAYGQYLVMHVARCQSCHSTPETILSSETYMGGGNRIRFDDEEKEAPDLTSSQVHGIGQWSESDIVRFLRTGMTPEKRLIDHRFCPIAYYRSADEADLFAVAAYLKTIPASD